MIEIPKSFKYNGEKYHVTSIGKGAFWNCSVTTVEIPNSVVSIEEEAFYNCACLTKINIPKSVTTIGDRAFDNCIELPAITIPNSVVSIGEGGSTCALLSRR